MSESSMPLALIVLADRHGTELGKRELHSEQDSCRALDDAVALVVALMIDPDAQQRPDEPTSATAPRGCCRRQRAAIVAC